MEENWDACAIRFDIPRLQCWPLGLHRGLARSKARAARVKRFVVAACATMLILGIASWIVATSHWRLIGAILMIVALSSIAAVQWLWWRTEWCSTCGTCTKSPFTRSRLVWCPGCYNLNDAARIRLADSKIMDLVQPEYLCHGDPIVRFVAITLLLALYESASQLRFEASKDDLRIVITVDDEDHELMPPPPFVGAAAVQAAIAMAGLEVSTGAQSQEGTFDVKVRSQIIPTKVIMQRTDGGETIVFQWDR